MSFTFPMSYELDDYLINPGKQINTLPITSGHRIHLARSSFYDYEDQESAFYVDFMQTIVV
jgi:hypothetical protein